MPHWLFVTKGYGLTVEDINGMCPADLKAYQKAYEIAQKEQDTYAWAMVGNYGISALLTVLDGVLNGKKAKNKYIEKPMTDEIQTKEVDRETLLKEWVRQRKIDKLNFDLWKIRQEKDGSS